MENSIENDVTNIPHDIIKLLADLDRLRMAITQNKKNGEELSLQFTIMDKKLSKYLHKEIKAKLKKMNKPKKPRGFAIPKLVSPQLCEFMKESYDSKISRTGATKYLMEYIKTNDLIDANNKKVIVPDDTLWKLLGDNAKYEEQLDRFNIQKYLNIHFTK
jgi:chromatin remodeling complex protein RSC6